MAYPNTVANLPGVMGTDWSYLTKPHRNGTGDINTLQTFITFVTSYANHVNFINTIFGFTQTIGSSYGSITRVFRLQHPEYSNFYATAFQFELTGFNTGGASIFQQYSHVRITVTFETLPYGIAGNTPFSTWNIKQGAVYTTAPGRKFGFASGEPLDQEAGAFSTLNSYILTLYNLPILNDSAIDNCAGCINNAGFQGRPAKQLLFNGCDSNIQNNVGGAITYQQSLSFTYRNYSWNQAYKANGTLDFPVDPSGNPPYSTADFTTLFAF